MKLTVLGSGTSTGVPLIGCSCQVCSSQNQKDHRRRASLLVHDERLNVLVDTGPDFREQILSAGVRSLDGVLYTHYHYDHMGGLNDLRPLSFHRREPLPCFCNQQTLDEIKRLYPYVFTREIPGQVNLDIKTYLMDDEQIYTDFTIAGLKVQPIRLMHVPPIKMECVGFVFNQKVGYLTDFKRVLPEYESFLYDLDVLILGSPLYKEHPTHISIPEALELIQKYKPGQGVISHLGHDHSHEELLQKLPSNVMPAYDGICMEFD